MRLGVAARTATYALMCVLSALVLLASGFSSYIVHDVSMIGGSNAIKSGPSIGAQNILLMGLESRTDWNGNVLPQKILDKLHAGSRKGVLYEGVGGNDTNTLILIHVFAGGKRAVGFSIPRDDLVNFADTVGPQQQGKIDQAYGISMYFEEGKLRQQDPHISEDRLAFLGNEAGRAAAVATVSKLTGVHIDHFAEVNLGGFYELAKVFGGVEVCIRQSAPHSALHDSYSGADLRHGYQHLDPEQALAFVRQRHGLPNGDLDRTHRQQAFIDSIIHQLRAEGVLSDLTKMSALLDLAKRYVITDSGWNLLDFAAQMRGLTGGHLIFHTLPILGYGTWGTPVQDVNLVSPSHIKSIVHAAFYPPPAPSRKGKHAHSSPHGHLRPVAQTPKATVDVFNGTQTPLLAAHVAAALAKAGYPTGPPANTAPRSSTVVEYGQGAQASAAAIAKLFGVTAVADQAISADRVQVLLGTGATVPVVSPSSQPSTTPAAIPTTGPQGGAVLPGKFGIPCVD
ncbi:MAG TPA: LCP family protein [Streptosporangiaceae bacterium]|nr:LCP family protein [Streptosporangiaceae bacterium]